MSEDNSTIRLRIESIVYDVLKREEITRLDVRNLIEEVIKNRELTVKDVDAIKKAINDSIEVVITNRLNAFMGRVHRNVGVVLAIFSAIFVTIQFILSFS